MKYMKKQILLIGLSFVMIAVLGSFTACVAEPKQIVHINEEPEQLFHINADDVAQIEVASGITGNRVYVEDREDIARIVEEMNNMQYARKETFEIRLGWWLGITLYDKDSNIIIRFLPRGTDGLELEMGDWRYTLATPFPFREIFYDRYLG